MNIIQRGAATPLPLARSSTQIDLRAHLLVTLIVAATVLKGLLWVFLVAPLDAPDEAAHFFHVMQIRAYGEWLPTVGYANHKVLVGAPSTPIDPPTAALVAAYGYGGTDSTPYESSQPPLYYWTAALLTAPLGDDRLALLYACRIVAVLFGAATVALAWWSLRLLWPTNSPLIWGVPLVLALLPETTFMSAVVSNDSALLFCCTALFAVWAAGFCKISSGRNLLLWALLAGLVTALALLSKVIAAITLPVSLLWLWWLAGTVSPRLTRRLPLFGAGTLLMLAAVTALSGWWIYHNLLVYGEPTGTAALFDVVRHQDLYLLKDGPWPTGTTRPLMVLSLIGVTAQSLIGIFGRMDLFLPLLFYIVPLVGVLTALLGLRRLLLWNQVRAGDSISLARRRLGWLAVAMVWTSISSFIYFNLSVAYQPQARYLFSGLVPLVLLIWVGIDQAGPSRRLNQVMLTFFVCSLAVAQIGGLFTLMQRSNILGG